MSEGDILVGEGYTLCRADFSSTLALVAARGGADLIITSPPYCDARDYGAGVSWTLEDYQRLGDAVAKALKPGGHCLLNVDAPVREWRKGFGTERGFMPWRIMFDWAERVGLRVVDRLAYGRQGLPGAYSGRFRNDWEPLFWFQRVGDAGYFDRFSIAGRAKTTKRPGSMSSARRSDGVLVPRGISGKAQEQGLKHRGTFWDYGNVGHGHDDKSAETTKHPARFFSGLADDAVLCFSPPGGLVCDPFLGSGTSAVAAVKHGRLFVGGDALTRADGKPWIEIARDRIEQVCQSRRSETLAMFG